MKHPLPLLIALAISGLAVDAWATQTARGPDQSASGTEAQQPYLQCVPYARRVSGIQIFGDAHTWWKQAEGRYARGTRPRVGSVMNFRPYGGSQLGHVAAVSRIVDARTVLIRHANWSPIDGRRGQIEDNVRAVDVSPSNDWSEVRVWYAPIGDLGTTRWPLYGFIHNAPANRSVESAPAATTREESSDPIGTIIARARRR